MAKTLLWCVVALFWGCSKPPAPSPKPGPAPLAPASNTPPPAPSICPDQASAPAQIPGVDPEQRTAAYWVKQAEAYGDPDAVLMNPADARVRNRAFRQQSDDRPYTVYDLAGPVDKPALLKELTERFEWLAERFTAKKYVDGKGQPMALEAQHARAEIADARLAPELRVALNTTQIYCAPTTRAWYTPSLDKRFNRNHCSSVHPQEPVQMLAEWTNGMRLVRTRYGYGWIEGDATLSAPVPAEHVQAYVHGPFFDTPAAQTVGGVALPANTPLPAVGDGALVAQANGFTPVSSAGLRSTLRPLTRRALIEEAFTYLDQPYGWGGVNGARDCSRFLMDVFASFGIELPRFSGSQSKAGEFSLDIKDIKDEAERLRIIEAAAQRGIVLLHLPGHVMLYLGKDANQRPMAIHAFAEYLEPCAQRDPARPEAKETLFKVDKISVTDLELGRGTSRTAFIERLTRITVFGPGAGTDLTGVAQSRPASPPDAPEDCKINDGYEIFYSPQRPNAKQPLRVILTSVQNPLPGRLVLEAPDGSRVEPPVRTLGLGPHTLVAQIDAPQVGKYRALFGDGERVEACRRIRVDHRKPRPRDASTTAWTPRLQWGEDTENFYSAFVESLFDYPLDEDVSWTNLHTVLRDPQRNLLFDHFSRSEEKKLRMKPDCADLPYFLRAYFAWKLGLPYAYRQCNRGRAGRPPTCQEINPATMDRPEGKNDIEAFAWFANRKVRNGVHSASGRTHPDNDETDFYPIPMERKWIRPGTLYADPYGHLLIVVKWLPQPMNGYGVLVAADGQPDGTIGRRRFWQGSFLFDPSTKDVGAGFKWFRPVIWQRRAGENITLTNAQLRKKTRIAPFSKDQYQGTADDFYDRMGALINPRPLDPKAMQQSLIDAFDESVRRRVTSVDNGIKWAKNHPRQTAKMPKGYSIFETVGPWEDFATPSRDLRLLISMYTVLKFTDRVKRNPERYGLTAQTVDAAVAELETTRDEALAARSITYVGSDGTERRLSLKEVLDRREGFEMAYNPNDCIEVRWAEAPDSPAMAACQKRAPARQTRRMAKYRQWFKDRRRPPR